MKDKDIPCIRSALEILVAANVIRVGVGVVNRSKPSSMCVKDLPDLSSGVLVITAVDQAYVPVVQSDEPDLCRALNVIVPFGNLYQFIHG